MSEDEKHRLASILATVQHEVERATAKHAPMHSLHEAYAVILEEVDELWDEVKKRAEQRSSEHVREELTQIAAMAVRALIDIRP